MVVADSLHREVATARMGLVKTYFARALPDKLKFPPPFRNVYKILWIFCLFVL